MSTLIQKYTDIEIQNTEMRKKTNTITDGKITDRKITGTVFGISRDRCAYTKKPATSTAVKEG